MSASENSAAAPRYLASAWSIAPMAWACKASNRTAASLRRASACAMGPRFRFKTGMLKPGPKVIL